MKLAAVIITLLAMSVCFAIAPALIIPPPDNQLTQVEINWTAVPTSSDYGIAETIWLTSILFSTAGTGRTVTATDLQGSPITWLTAISLSANQITSINVPPGARMQGGFKLVASGSGVVYQFRGKVKR